MSTAHKSKEEMKKNYRVVRKGKLQFGEKKKIPGTILQIKNGKAWVRWDGQTGSRPKTPLRTWINLTSIQPIY